MEHAAVAAPRASWRSRAADARRALRGGGALLSVGTLSSGVLAYAFNVAVARALGAADYGPVAVLWAAMFLVSVILFRPVEQTLSRGIAERLAQGEDARPVLRSAGRLTVGIALVAMVAIGTAWVPITDRLFDGRDAFTAAFAVGVAGYALSYYVRGVASGVQWFGGYGGLLLADGAIRVLLVVPLITVASPTLAAVAIATAAVGGAVAPLIGRALAVRRGTAGPVTAELHGRRAAPFHTGQALGFAAPVAIIAASEQVLVSGGALLIALTGHETTAVAGTVFAATMLVRAPVFLFQGVAAFLLPTLTRLDAQGAHAAFGRRVGLISVAMGALAAVLVGGSLVAGPQVMKLLFGPTFVVGRVDLAVLSAGVGSYLIGATLSQAALARGQASVAASVWALGASLFVAVELALPGAAFHRVSVAFTLAVTVVCAGFLVLVRRRATIGQVDLTDGPGIGALPASIGQPGPTIEA